MEEDTPNPSPTSAPSPAATQILGETPTPELASSLAAHCIKSEPLQTASVAAEANLSRQEPTGRADASVGALPAFNEDSPSQIAAEEAPLISEQKLGPTAEFLDSSCGWEVHGKVEVKTPSSAEDVHIQSTA